VLGTAAKCCGAVCFLLVAGATELCAQKAPYDVFPPAEAPYYRVRYDASDKPGELIYGVNYTAWILPGGKVPRPCLFERLDRVLEKTKPEVVLP
jgi:hypothetical protein